MTFQKTARVAHALRLMMLGGLLAGVACAGSSSAAGSGTAAMSRGDRYVITAGELAEAGANNLYDAIAKVRPDFFRPRGNTLTPAGTPTRGDAASTSSTVATPMSGGANPVRVYHGDQMLTGTDDLRQIPISSVVDVRFIPGPQAGVRYGTNHSGGVILVRTR